MTHKAYQAFAAQAGRLTPAQWEARMAAGEWSPREVVAHLVGWDVAWAEGLRLVLAGTPELFHPPTNVDQFNAASVAQRQHVSWAELCTDLAAAETEVQALAPLAERAGLPSEGGFGNWLLGRAEDYTHHAAQLQQWCETRSDR